MSSNRVRVTRTLVYEGDYDWIEFTLSKGLVFDDHGLWHCANGTIKSTIVGIPQPVPEPTPKTDAVVAALEKRQERTP
jgi:hypothetical protein